MPLSETPQESERRWSGSLQSISSGSVIHQRGVAIVLQCTRMCAWERWNPREWKWDDDLEKTKSSGEGCKKKPYRGASGEWTVNMWTKARKRVVMCNPLSTDHLRVRVQRDWTLGAQRWSEQAHLLQRGSRCSMGEDSSDRPERCVIGLDENDIGLGRPARDYGPSI